MASAKIRTSLAVSEVLAVFHEKEGGAPSGEARGMTEPALECAGFALWRVAEHLREVRERWPAADDLARRLRRFEDLARRIASDVKEQLENRGAPKVNLAPAGAASNERRPPSAWPALVAKAARSKAVAASARRR